MTIESSPSLGIKQEQMASGETELTELEQFINEQVVKLGKVDGNDVLLAKMTSEIWQRAFEIRAELTQQFAEQGAKSEGFGVLFRTDNETGESFWSVMYTDSSSLRDVTYRASWNTRHNEKSGGPDYWGRYNLALEEGREVPAALTSTTLNRYIAFREFAKANLEPGGFMPDTLYYDSPGNRWTSTLVCEINEDGTLASYAYAREDRGKLDVGHRMLGASYGGGWFRPASQEYEL